MITKSTHQPTPLERLVAYSAKAMIVRYNEAKLVAKCVVLK